MSDKIHVIKDESLGGVLREYVEVDRKADVGDYVLITRFEGSDVRHFAKVTEVDDYANEFEFSPEYKGSYLFDYEYDEKCVVIEPTDIVQIDGQRYRMVGRKAKVDEKVLITKGAGWYEDKVGDVRTVIDGKRYGFSRPETYVEHGGNNRHEIHFIETDNYRVLEPIKPTLEELTSKITDENRHEAIEKYTKEWNYVCEINENKTLIIPDAVNVEMVTEGVPETFVKFLDVNNEIVCLYKLNEIKGLYKNQIL